MTKELVEHFRGENWTNSNLIAEKLDKNHNHVMAKIRKLLNDLSKFTDETSSMKKKVCEFGRSQQALKFIPKASPLDTPT